MIRTTTAVCLSPLINRCYFPRISRLTLVVKRSLGSNPPQMPNVGTPEWEEFVKRLKEYQENPPLSDTFKTHEGAFSLKTSIPGLGIYPNFLSTLSHEELQEQAVGFYQKIRGCLQNSSIQTGTTYLSKYHNLKSKEFYRIIQMEDEEKISGQHFETYGEDGHTLTYFIGTKNLPLFIKNGLLSRVLKLSEISDLSQGRLLNWNLTFNTYSVTENQPTHLPGFDFHKDIKSNGEITMIYSTGAPSEFHIRHPDKPAEVQKFPLFSNSLLLLSKEARWDYEHCVVPVPIEGEQIGLHKEIDSIKRISIVLGCS